MCVAEACSIITLVKPAHNTSAMTAAAGKKGCWLETYALMSSLFLRDAIS
jgi:hypothetical protein